MTPAHPHTTNLAVGAQAHCPTPFPISASLGGRAGSHWGLQHGGKHPVTVVPPAFAMKLGRLVQATGSGRPSLRAAGQPEPPLRATVTTLTGHSTRDSGLRPTAAEGTTKPSRREEVETRDGPAEAPEQSPRCPVETTGGPGWVSPPEMGPRTRNQLPLHCVQETLIPSGKAPVEAEGPRLCPLGSPGFLVFSECGDEGGDCLPPPPPPPRCSHSAADTACWSPRANPRFWALQIRGAREPRLTRAGRASEAGRTAEPRATGGSAEGGQAKTARAAGGSRVGCREAAELRAPSRTREAALIHLQQATMLCPHSDSHAGAQSHGHGPGHSGSRRTQQPCSALTCHVVPTHRLPTAFARAGTLDSHVPWDFGVRAHLGAPGQLRGPHRRSLHRHGVHPEELL
uniref:Uncharacterized protein n=1 Tax=Rangifer tarandus platyrhynchus TaxID=3082113 RepID=A0ACB0DZE2_RANTA|nr:unnamed protein product [Rangifer tarandus platyrhynchus]